MTLILVLIIFFNFTNSSAQTLQASAIWYTGNTYFPVEIEKQTHHLISRKCDSHKCLAFKALGNTGKKAITGNDLSGGKNPGAVICKKHYQAEIIILRDENKNENAFCKFSDGSIVTASALR